MATGDFNGDGITDLVFDGSLTVVPGTGPGEGGVLTYGAPVSYGFSPPARSVKTGDFNGDGVTDLVCAVPDSGQVSVLLGNGVEGVGDGTFQQRVDYSAGYLPWDVALGDFNSDGVTDLAIATGGTTAIMVFVGNKSGGVGDGTFSLRTSCDIQGPSSSVATGDFNADGILDLVVANYWYDSVSVLLGDGVGNVGVGYFLAPTDFDAGTRPLFVTTGDFNGDGIIDLVTANSGSDDVSVILGNGSGGLGDGTFRAPVNHGVENYPGSVLTGDFNDDGITDLAVAYEELSRSVSVLIGNGSQGVGDGSFQAPTDYFTGTDALHVATLDYDGDGIDDLCGLSSTVILRGRGTGGIGDGTFETPDVYPVGVEPDGMATGDFNGDGITDLTVANSESDNVSVLLGNSAGDGTLQPAIPYGAGDGTTAVVTGDFNSDGIADLATSNSISDNVSILLGVGSDGVGDGTFQAAIQYVAGDGADVIAAEDFNEDGVTDLVTGNYNSDNISVLMGNGTDGVGDGTFQAPVNYTAGISPVCVRTLDLNGDDVTDLVVANGRSANVSIFLGNGSDGVGDGTFQSAVNYNGGAGISTVLTEDLNSDGIVDLLTLDSGWDEISILYGNGSGGVGDGTFQARVHYGIDDAITDLALADFDADGAVDFADVAGGRVRIRGLNLVDGAWNGTFETKGTFFSGKQGKKMTTADFNGDGYLDVAVSNGGYRGVTVLLNRGYSAVLPPVAVLLAEEVSSLTDDTNGDGIIDAADVVPQPPRGR